MSTAGFRTFYASRACTALFIRCIEVIDGDCSTDTYPMPLMMITPFDGRLAGRSPPSLYELHAASVFRTRDELLEARWNGINTAGNNQSVIDAQSMYVAGLVEFNRIYFGSFSSDTNDQFTYRGEGSYNAFVDNDIGGNNNQQQHHNNNPPPPPPDIPPPPHPNVHNPYNPQDGNGNGDIPAPDLYGNGNGDIPVPDLDNHGLPKARERADCAEILRDPYAVLDHLSVAQCAGFAGFSFNEIQHIWRPLQVPWAGAYSDALRNINDKLETPRANSHRGELELERAIKWKFLLPALLLRKPPSANGIKATDLQPIITRRMNQYDSGDWSGLIADYEADVIAAESLGPKDDNSTQEEKDEAQIRKAADLLSRFQ